MIYLILDQNQKITMSKCVITALSELIVKVKKVSKTKDIKCTIIKLKNKHQQILILHEVKNGQA